MFPHASCASCMYASSMLATERLAIADAIPWGKAGEVRQPLLWLAKGAAWTAVAASGR